MVGLRLILTWAVAAAMPQPPPLSPAASAPDLADKEALQPGVGVAVVSSGTNGPMDAAGGSATGDTLARGQVLGLDARSALANNDSYHYLAALGDLVVSGPTNTNVNDLIFVLCWQ